MSSLDSPYYDFRLAIPEVCRELCTRLSAVKDACLKAERREGFLDNWDGTRSTDRRQVVPAITRALTLNRVFHLWIKGIHLSVPGLKYARF